MKVAFLITDAREHFRAYNETKPYFPAGVDALLEGIPTVSGLEVHIVSCTQRPMCSPEKLADNIWYHSVHVPKFGWLRTLYQGCIRATRRQLRELQPDLVHGHGTERDCSLCAVLSGFPNVMTIHGNMAEQARLYRPRIGSYLWMAARLENFAVRRTAGVICNSTYTEERVQSIARKTWHVPHAVRGRFLNPAPRVGSISRPCVLLNAGVVSPRKRQLELLDVAERLYRQGLKFEFRFIGFISPESDYGRAFLERIKPMEAAGYARFVGTVPEAELVSSFDSAAGVIHFPTEEAFGNVVVEALARNLKFFGSRLGGIVDIATDAPGAELFDRDDWGGLTAAIGRWIAEGHQSPSDAASMIQKRYSPETIAGRYMMVYREVLKIRS